ncbi:MAG TPA: phosphate ABC transporter permease PstC, partial [Chloroflexia bacterium]|nr:phosphate ABC transporter permease PstC [Chloroflexia bacterium]
MAVTTRGPVLTRPGRAAGSGDPLFKRLTLGLASAVILVVGAMLANMAWESRESLARFGWSFLGGQVWDPVHTVYGALPFIYGTLITSLIALLLAGTIGLGAALFLTEIAPGWLRTPLS